MLGHSYSKHVNKTHPQATCKVFKMALEPFVSLGRGGTIRVQHPLVADKKKTHFGVDLRGGVADPTTCLTIGDLFFKCLGPPTRGRVGIFR